MIKNKSIDYIFGMITGISVSITFWACTNTDLIASNDTSNETSSIQQVEITNWSDMPAVAISGTPTVAISSSGNAVSISGTPEVKISSLGNDVDCDITNTPTVQFSSLGNDVEINGSIDCNVDFPSSMNVTVTNEPIIRIDDIHNNVDCDLGSGSIDVKVTNASWDPVHVTIED